MRCIVGIIFYLKNKVLFFLPKFKLGLDQMDPKGKLMRFLPLIKQDIFGVNQINEAAKREISSV